MPTATPWVPHWDSSDFGPVKGNMPPTTSGASVDALAPWGTELADASPPVRVMALASATPTAVVRRTLAFLITCPPFVLVHRGVDFASQGRELLPGDLVGVRPPEENRREVK